MTEAAIDIEGLEKRYGSVRALENFTMRVEPGAIGLLGPNGAGKSTFIKCLLGLIHPDAGTGTVLGLDIRTRSMAIRQAVGYMPEDDVVIPRVNAVNYVAFSGRMVGMSSSDAMARAHEVLSYSGLEEARYRRVEDFSTGMKQRAKLAQAIVHHPRLVFLDEPTSGLDPKGREEMLSLIADLTKNHGMSVFFSTHILPDVEAVCDRVVVLKGGRFIAGGRIDELKKDDTESLVVRIKGDESRFKEILARHGLAPRRREDGDLEVDIPTRGGGRADATRRVLEAAREASVQVRHLRRGKMSLEDLFERLVEG
ncbi:MAG: ABC transporter ATP-binding protein [Planctomycetes bacterium]|nr:ABC transporter ATP-binding protein [Planctomycetota bacterium]